jgi:hypothetical protein
MDTETIGFALLVAGAVLLCSGLVFMLLVLRKRQAEQEEIEETYHRPPIAGDRE